MHLTSQKVLLLSLVLVMSCSDSSGPATVSGRFELNDIDGRALPTPFSFTPGLTPTILSSTITFDGAGHAVITEHRTEWNGADTTDSRNFTYTITGSRIELTCAPPIDPGAVCGTVKGTFLFGRLSLEMGHINSDPIIYHYRLAN